MIGNYINSLAHGDVNKKKRLLKKETKVNEKENHVNPDTSGTDFEEKHAFRKRRDQILKAKTTKKCFDIAPIYRTIEGVLIKFFQFNVFQIL